MNNYLIEIWFRHRNEQEDFEQILIDSDTEEEARSIARDLRSLVYKIETLEINGQKVINDNTSKA